MRNDAIEFRPLTRHIGAEVDGVDLREPLDIETPAFGPERTA